MKAKICIHCAGLADDKSDRKNLLRVNKEGTENIFNNIRADHFIYISSASVYPPNGLLHSEEEEIEESQLSDYGFSKLKTEQWLEAQTGRKKKITVLRPRAVYGQGDRVLLPRILQLKKGPFVIKPGSLGYKISLTNIENLLQATAAVIKSENEYPFDIFNIADNPTYILSEVIDEVFRMAGYSKSSVIRIPQSIIQFPGKLFPKSSLNATTLKYFLCNHEVSNQKIKRQFNIDLPTDFHAYKPVLQNWIDSLPKHLVKKGNADLPWRV